MKTIVSKKKLGSVVKILAKQINRAYSGVDELIVVCILKGSFIFAADLIRQLTMPVKIEFMSVSSYKDNVQTTDIKINLDINISITGKHVLVVDDIIDSGITLSKVLNLFRSRQPRSLGTCVLLNKEITDMKVDFCGITIPNVYVFGYGLDDKQMKRNIPFIASK